MRDSYSFALRGRRQRATLHPKRFALQRWELMRLYRKPLYQYVKYLVKFRVTVLKFRLSPF